MEKLTPETENILTQRFGKDNILALATVEKGLPCVRNVDAYYENGTFYVITHALSGKMQQIGKDPHIALAGEWFTARGFGENLGHFCKPENRAIATKLRTAFAAWIDNGHNDFTDKNTIILALRLTTGTLFSNGRRFDIDFT